MSETKNIGSKKVLSILLGAFFIMSMAAVSVSAHPEHRDFDGHHGSHYHNHRGHNYDNSYANGYKAGFSEGFSNAAFNGDTGNNAYNDGYKDGYNAGKEQAATASTTPTTPTTPPCCQFLTQQPIKNRQVTSTPPTVGKLMLPVLTKSPITCPICWASVISSPVISIKVNLEATSLLITTCSSIS
jgi:hypothetical protein